MDPFPVSAASCGRAVVNDIFPGGLKSWLFCNNDPGSRCGGCLLRALAVEWGKAVSNVVIEEGAACRVFFIEGDGAGNAVLQQKYPDPYL